MRWISPVRTSKMQMLNVTPWPFIVGDSLLAHCRQRTIPNLWHQRRHGPWLIPRNDFLLPLSRPGTGHRIRSIQTGFDASLFASHAFIMKHVQ